MQALVLRRPCPSLPVRYQQESPASFPGRALGFANSAKAQLHSMQCILIADPGVADRLDLHTLTDLCPPFGQPNVKATRAGKFLAGRSVITLSVRVARLTRPSGPW